RQSDVPHTIDLRLTFLPVVWVGLVSYGLRVENPGHERTGADRVLIGEDRGVVDVVPDVLRDDDLPGQGVQSGNDGLLRIGDGHLVLSSSLGLAGQAVGVDRRVLPHVVEGEGY